MMKNQMLFILIFVVTVTLALEKVQHSGTIEENVILTDLDGRTINLFELLDKGMHVLVFQTAAT